jgi:hypothetical protein
MTAKLHQRTGTQQTGVDGRPEQRRIEAGPGARTNGIGEVINCGSVYAGTELPASEQNGLLRGGPQGGKVL